MRDTRTHACARARARAMKYHGRVYYARMRARVRDKRRDVMSSSTVYAT